MRLIDADALLDAISVHLERIEQEFDDAPNIDPVRHGRWIGKTDVDGDEVYTCSECGEELYWVANYCPNCGAKMDGGKE